MSNPYYTRQTDFVPGTRARSIEVDAELNAVEDGFDLLPAVADSLKLGTSTFGVESQGATVNDFEVTMPNTRTSNAQGDEVVFEATHTNTGAATLAVDGVAAVPIVRADGSACSGGEIVSGLFYQLRYDASGVRFQLMALEPASAGETTEIIGTSTNDPTSPGVFNANLPWRNANSETLARMGFNTDTHLAIQNQVHGGNIRLSAEDAGGTARLLLEADPDARRVVTDRALRALSAGGTVPILEAYNEGAGADFAAGRVELSGHNSIGADTKYVSLVGGVSVDVDGSEESDFTLQYYNFGVKRNYLNIQLDGNGRLYSYASAAALSLLQPGTPDWILQLETIPATAGDRLGSISWAGKASNGLSGVNYARVYGEAEDDTFGAQSGRLRFSRYRAGTNENALVLDDAASLYFQGSVRLQTTSDGVLIPWTELDINRGADADVRFIMRNSIGGLQQVVQDTSGNLELWQSDAGGAVEKRWGIAARDAGWSFYHNGTLRLQTTASGLSIPGSLVDLFTTSDVRSSYRLRNSVGGAQFEVTETQGLWRVQQTDDVGALEKVWLSATRDAGVTLYHNNVAKAFTGANGWGVVGTQLDLNAGAASTTELLVRNSVGGLILQTRNDGLMNIRQSTSAGAAEKFVLHANRNGDVGLYHNGVLRFNTRSNGFESASGSAESLHILARNSVGGFSHYHHADGTMRLTQTNSSGTPEKTVLLANRDAEAILYHNNTARLRTANPLVSDIGMGAEVHDGGGNFRPVGMNIMPQFSADANQTFDLARVGYLFRHESANARNWTVPNDANIPVGATYVLLNRGTGNITVVQGSGVTLSWEDGSGGAPPTGSRTLSRSGVATLYKRGDTIWSLWGSGLS